MKWRWEPGRLGSGYRKFCLWSGLGIDCYVIDYPVGSGTPIHVDSAPAGKEHHRLNIVLHGDAESFHAFPPIDCLDLVGRVNVLHRPKRWLDGRVTYFRPDVVKHKVWSVGKRRIVLSIGWLRNGST